MFVYHLLRPFSYLFIDYEEKWRLDWGLPLVVAAITSAVLGTLAWFHPFSILGDSGLLGKLISLVQTLPGFYIAALAAIATFNRLDIDRTMPMPAPRINILMRGRKVPIDLTRRRFLCMLMAFLTAESLVLIVGGIFAQVIAPALRLMVPDRWHFGALFAPLFLYLLLFWQMMFVTFLGLFYLGERIHQPDDAN